MKFDLEIENEVGCVAITLDRDFADGEMEAIVKLAKSLLKKKPAQSESSPSVIAWAGANTYYRLEFLNPSNQIVAIREIRATLGCGLKEARDIVMNITPCPPLSVHNASLIKEALARAGVTEYSLTEVER
jgi:ribosomal protein L7/L12